jgi:DNA-binding NarL/FixJ family response regulator/predicted negative regulator of RcsB-dependent stress response
VADGQALLAAGDWAAARAAFETELEGEETPEALNGLATALLWLGETEQAVGLRERAFAAFRRRPDDIQAATTALSLYFMYRSNLGNVAASRGWLARAGRLAEELALPPLTGWVECAGAHDSDDPVAAERMARSACDAARAGGDVDLELCALSQLGIALVDQGRVAEGAKLLDEAMAASLGGEGEQLQTVVYTSCNMILACSRASQFERATQWIRATGPFTKRYGSPHVYTLCRLHHGKVLLSTGDWAAAEAELEDALRVSHTSEPSLTAETLAALAELRLAQGRIEDAEALVAPVAEHPVTTAVRAALHLARDQPDAAEALVRRRLRVLGEERLESAALLELQCAAELAGGRAEAAAESARRLSALAGRTGSEAVMARAERALGTATADRELLERALERFAALELPLEAARTQHRLARELDGEAAVATARAALATFERLGAPRDADAAAALLRTLGVRATRPGPRSGDVLTRREREVLALLGEGLSNRAIAERLVISEKTAQHHVAAVLFKLDLSNRAQAAAYAARRLHEREHA